MIRKAKARAKTKNEKVWRLVTLVGSPDILLEAVGETTVASDTAHSSSGGAPVTTHAVAQQPSTVTQKKVYTKIFNRDNKKMELLNAKRLVSEAKA